MFKQTDSVWKTFAKRAVKLTPKRFAVYFKAVTALVTTTGAPRPGPAQHGPAGLDPDPQGPELRHSAPPPPPRAAPSSTPAPRSAPRARSSRGKGWQRGNGGGRIKRKGPPCSASAGGDRTATGIFNLTLARGPRLRLICHPRPVTVMHFTHCRGRARGEPSGTGRAGLAAERVRCVRAVAGNKSYSEPSVRLIP